MGAIITIYKSFSFLFPFLREIFLGKPTKKTNPLINKMSKSIFFKKLFLGICLLSLILNGYGVKIYFDIAGSIKVMKEHITLLTLQKEQTESQLRVCIKENESDISEANKPDTPKAITNRKPKAKNVQRKTIPTAIPNSNYRVTLQDINK